MSTHLWNAHVVHGLAAILTLGTAAAAHAQDRQTPKALRSVEIGTSLNTLVMLTPPDGGAAFGFGDVRAKVPLGDRFALEGSVSIPRRQARDTQGFYGVQVKQRLVRASRGRTEAFLTYGGVGYYDHHPAFEYRYESSDGPHVSRGPARTYVSWPFVAAFGGGVQRQVAARLLVRVDAQALWLPFYPEVASRLSAGIAVPLGRSE